MDAPASSSSSETGSRSKRFPRSHRLRHQRLIRPLFDRSRSDVRTVAFGCVRLLYRVVSPAELPPNAAVQVGFAPGRVRTAVQRNRIKRRMREIYRNHQHVLAPETATGLTVMVLFRGRPEQASGELDRDLPEAIRRLATRLKDPARS